ncbi:MAG: NUDIX domain-containing protein [Hyphomicrobiaceae bacterium]|nr:NUDIX domain-containing protein [Hyphomicrobiaceae bacterium]
MSRAVSLFLQRYWRFSRGLTLAVEAAVIDGEGRFLLIRGPRERFWRLPGGPVEKGEAAGDAVARVLRTRAAIEPGGAAELFAVYRAPPHTGSDHVALMVVRAWSAWTPNRHGARSRSALGEIGSFGPGELPRDTDPVAAARISDVARGTPTPDEA